MKPYDFYYFLNKLFAHIYKTKIDIFGGCFYIFMNFIIFAFYWVIVINNLLFFLTQLLFELNFMGKI